MGYYDQKNYQAPSFWDELGKAFQAIELDGRNRRAEKRAEAAEKRAEANELRAREHEIRQIKQQEFEAASRRQAEEAKRDFDNPPETDVLGGSRLGTLEDAQKDGLLNPDGIYLGFLEGHPIYYNGTDHMVNYGKTRSGKGRDIVLPNLAHVFDRSLLVNDIKDGENAFAAAEYRASQGHRQIGINPHGFNYKGVESCRLNPFQPIINKAQRGDDITALAFELCMSLIPPTKENEWVADDAQLILATWLEWCARFFPEQCKLSEMWRFINKQFDEDMSMILDCGVELLEGHANKIMGWRRAEKQWQAYESALSKALRYYSPDSDLAKVTDASDFDPADMRREKMTVYLMTDSNLLGACKSWISLTTSCIINTCAQTRGSVRVTCIIDELANLPYIAAISTCLKLFAGKGVQLYGLSQGREALREQGYKESTIKTFEAQSGLINVWEIRKEKDVLEDVERWSGWKTVAVKGINQGGGAVENAGRSLTYHKRPVLQSDDIFQIGEGKQIICTNGPYLYVAERVSWTKVRNWKHVLKDVRTLHGE